MEVTAVEAAVVEAGCAGARCALAAGSGPTVCALANSSAVVAIRRGENVMRTSERGVARMLPLSEVLDKNPDVPELRHLGL